MRPTQKPAGGGRSLGRLRHVSDSGVIDERCQRKRADLVGYRRVATDRSSMKERHAVRGYRFHEA